MMRFRLRTLLIVLALGPMVLAWCGWPAYLAYRDHQHRKAMQRLLLTTPRIITNADADGVRL